MGGEECEEKLILKEKAYEEKEIVQFFLKKPPIESRISGVAWSYLPLTEICTYPHNLWSERK